MASPRFRIRTLPVAAWRLRFTMRTMMIIVAVVAVALALILARRNSTTIIDPFDHIEMLGPSQDPLRAWKGRASTRARDSSPHLRAAAPIPSAGGEP
jgi:hypothetical protein